MKKTLLASALMLAFSASAMAGVDGRYEYLEGVAGTVTEANNVGNVDRVLGGWRKSAQAEGVLNSDVAVKGGKWNMVVGGFYSGDANGTVNVNSTKVYIESAEVTQVVAGSGGSDNKQLNFSDSESSSLTIKSGTFGSETVAGNCPELLVVGGDLIKTQDINANSLGGKSNIDTVNIEISGGTFNAAVIGGSAAIQYYGATGEPEGAGINVNVDEVNMNITGGTFNHAIVAGGLAYNNHTMKSTVGKANVNISGVTLGEGVHIFAGGMHGGIGSSAVNSNIVSTVGETALTIKDASVNNIYGTAAWMNQPGGNNTAWSYVADEAVTVKTDLTMTNVEAKAVNIPVGSVALRAEGGKQTKITEALTVGSDVSVSLTTDGATNDKYAGDISKAIVINDWDYSTAEEVKMEEGLVMGEVTMVDGKLVEKTNRVQLATLDMASALPLAMGRILMNDVRKRLGDIRSAEGTHGVWARYDGGEMSGDNNFENKFHTIQVGIDTVPTPDSGRFGVAFSYTKGDSEFGRGESDMDAFSLAAYGTWIADNGMFADVIGRMATIDNDLTIDNSIGAKTDNVLLSLSGEIGWRFNMTETFYLEPQAELTYTYVNSDRFTLNTVEYDVDATDSLIARIGFAAGLKCPDNFGDVYVRASAVHEFLGDSAVQAAAAKPVELDGEDTWVEFGIGANFNINKNTYVYADIERTEGAKLEEDWRANVGVRFAF